jgi:hypothetical protein
LKAVRTINKIGLKVTKARPSENSDESLSVIIILVAPHVGIGVYSQSTWVRSKEVVWSLIVVGRASRP